jgi:hypothetical protein
MKTARVLSYVSLTAILFVSPIAAGVRIVRTTCQGTSNFSDPLCLIHSGSEPGKLNTHRGISTPFENYACTFVDPLPPDSTPTSIDAVVYGGSNLTTAVGNVSLRWQDGQEPVLLTEQFAIDRWPECGGTISPNFGGGIPYSAGIPHYTSKYGFPGATGVNTIILRTDGFMSIEDIDVVVAYRTAGTVTFDLTAPTKILLHNYRKDLGGYPSPQQVADGVMEITGIAKGINGAPLAGETVYFAAEDVPDTAPYAAVAPGPNDNLDPTHPKGRMSPNYAVTGSDGTFKTVFVASDHVAGDNYQIAAALDDPQLQCGANCVRSGVLTTWRRAYLEVDEMRKQGTLITYPALAGADGVYVNDRTGLHAGVSVVLLHAPSRRRDQPNDVDGFYEERHAIASVRRNNSGSSSGTWFVEFTQPLAKEFDPDPSSNASFPIGDAISVDTANPIFRANLSYMQALYDDAFLEYVIVPESHVQVPYYQRLNPTMQLFVSEKWMRSKTHYPDVPPNHGLCLIANEGDQPAVGVSLGTTHGTKYSAVWQGTIDVVTSPSYHLLVSGHDPVKVGGEVLVHELAHQWAVDLTTAGHCSYSSFRNSAKFCEMNSPGNSAEYDDGQVAFHYVRNGAAIDSEYMTIRTSTEPKP